MKAGRFGLAIVILLLLSAFEPVLITDGEDESINQRLLNAVNYIKNRYDPRIGLVSESEDTGSNVPDELLVTELFGYIVTTYGHLKL